MSLRCCVFAALVWISISVRAQDGALISVGETWRYFRGTMEPSAPIEAWREREFDDNTWAQGISGFGNGFGIEYGEPTQFPDLGVSAAYTSVYVRKTFSVTNLATLRWLTLRIDYSDGFVAYVNGREVARRNLPQPPGVAVPFDAVTGATHARGALEEIDLTPMRTLLRPGENVLAIQVHTSGPVDFSFTLLPELLANFTRGPFVQNSSTDRIQVIWKTPVPTDGTVEFGPTPALGNSVASAARGTLHAVSLVNLTPDTTYYYRVRSADGPDVARSSLATFRTLKTSGPVRFAVLGDTGTGSPYQYQVAEQLRRANPDLVLHVGDVTYPLFTTNWVDPRCFSVYQPQMRSTPFYFAIGNHDLYAGDFAYLESFYLPTNSITGTEHFYSFDHGDAHFTVLLQPYTSQYLLTPGDSFRQYEWLTNDLASTTKPWKFIFMHVPMATSGAHRFDDFGPAGRFGTADRLEIMDAVLPAAARYGVQMIFAGHDHNYERFHPIDGVTSIVTGGGGVLLRWLVEFDRASSQFWLQYHFVQLTVDGDTCRLEAINSAGQTFDTVTVRRAPPADELYASTAHTPPMPDTPADDLDGNVTGQRFDFAGAAVPTVTGRLSNLGRVFVNNDATHLYVGFEQCSIYADQNIFLFIDSPRLPGVTNLVGLGNGVLDAAGQGADGLDFLENLSFTNRFKPAVGLILGDEFADAPARSFARFGGTFAAGQGAFFLEAGLRDVPGVRLQQFNRSPQLGGFPGEDSANFIVVAIPLSALGAARPGDVLQLGAVVGLGGVDVDPKRQTRNLDTGYLGRSLRSAGHAPALLEGMRFRLVFDPNGDDDNDGVKNSEEARLGTDPFNPDSDGDGLRDGWEVANRLNPRNTAEDEGADGDPDGDGLSNAREQFLGTNPRSARSSVRLQFEAVAPDRVRLNWPTVAGKRYQLEYAERLPDNFSNVAPDVFPWRAASTNQTFQLELSRLRPNPGTHFFFRVRVVE